ncbi:DUF1552 domain-containing protein [Luteolibacter sp. GHJ8]|uniref:DUF1552 domain-containing protein n=1 Tax=Luteolibacter rhizosphaerae TaxID=2989719 RepID=A0ABT3G2Q4_9BACT|nr:DUF1552 domain-containing protein [Luteolibacter rhizosphaerae]MCW1914119.1 DUF1552 domain-containing protein [Luteolibacter rhizosphaerae]
MNDAALNRRRFLRGMGALLALPSLEAFMPRAMAASATGRAVATTASGAPLRMAFLYFPNGAIQSHWTAEGAGADFRLANTLEPLQALKHRVQVISGLEHLNADPGNDGAGDHARANGTFLTGVRVKKTAGSDIYAGISVDQIVAQNIGRGTRFASLEMSCDPHRKSGGCDSGYSCAYESNLAWRTPTSPLSPESNPRLIFERLFGSGNPGERGESLARRRAQQRSILDFVMEDAKAIQGQLTHRDKAKMDEYLTGIREIEQQIETAEGFKDIPDPAMVTPDGIPRAYDDYIKLMFQMTALAFETDATRVATMLLARDGSNRSFPEIQVAEGHHSLSHHREDKDMIDKVTRIDRFYADRFAEFLAQLESKQDVDGKSILHNSMIVYGCGNSDGNRHTHSNLPVVLAGNGGGALNPGRHITHKSTPMCNLYLNMLDSMGVPQMERFGDSTGRLGEV